MKIQAIAKNITISPRKVRHVAEAIKKLPVDVAVAQLSALPHRATDPIQKVLLSAIANAVNNNKIERGNLRIAELFVTEGISYKRFHFAGRGRTRPYKKRTSHITVILEEVKVAPVVEKETKNVKTKAPKEAKK